jgi:hypothetical protein
MQHHAQRPMPIVSEHSIVDNRKIYSIKNVSVARHRPNAFANSAAQADINLEAYV